MNTAVNCKVNFAVNFAVNFLWIFGAVWVPPRLYTCFRQNMSFCKIIGLEQCEWALKVHIQLLKLFDCVVCHASCSSSRYRRFTNKSPDNSLQNSFYYIFRNLETIMCLTWDEFQHDDLMIYWWSDDIWYIDDLMIYWWYIDYSNRSLSSKV